MALFQVSGYKPNSEFSGKILGATQTHLFDRPNHYSFGTKIQEFAVPLGEEVSMLNFKHLRKKNTESECCDENLLQQEAD